jgi:hypothetical protein
MTIRTSLLAVAALTPAFLGAQEWRTLDVSRQLRDSGQFRVHVQYGAGKLDIRPTSDPVLYSMQLRYDETNGRPVHRYSAEGRSVTLGLTDQSVHLHDGNPQRKNDLRLALSRAVPLELELDVGAAQSDIDLGGLNLREARIHTGASASKISFGTPSPDKLRSLDIDLGAASLEVSDLANANVSEVHVKGGVGSVTLGFGGTWTQDATVDVNVAFGKIEIRVPSEVGVRVEVQRFLAGFDHRGLEKRGNAYYSDNWDTAKYHLRVHAESVFGAIEINRW